MKSCEFSKIYKVETTIYSSKFLIFLGYVNEKE